MESVFEAFALGFHHALTWVPPDAEFNSPDLRRLYFEGYEAGREYRE